MYYRIRSWFRRVGFLTIATLAPALYLSYMWLVWRTSRVRDIGCDPMRLKEHYGRCMVAFWHEEVAFVAYAMRKYDPVVADRNNPFAHPARAPRQATATRRARRTSTA